MKFETDLKTIADFYKVYPELKNQISVKTRFGYKPIEEATVTAKNETVYVVELEDRRVLKGSGNHLLWKHNEEWTKIFHLNPGDVLETLEGPTVIKDVYFTNKKDDLYDLQVADVKEFYANGIVSHNSTIFETIHYGLYGTPLREISKDHIKNSLTKGKCEVTLDFEIVSNNTTDSYKVIRQLNPTKCQLFKNGEDITRSTLAKTNEYIQNLIRTPLSVFQNSVITSANNTLPFMALSKTDKRKFIESILGLEVFSQMVLRARDEFNQTKKEYDISFSKFEQLKKENDFNNSQLENYEKEKQERLEKISQKKKVLEQDIQTLREKIAKFEQNSADSSSELDNRLKELKQEKNALEEKLNKINSKFHKIDAEINNEKKQIKSLQTNKDKCPTCSRDYSEEHLEHVNKLIEKHENTILQYQEALEKVQQLLKETKQGSKDTQKSIEDIQEKKLEIQKKSSEKTNLENNIKLIENSLKDLEEDTININKSNNNQALKEKIKQLEKEISQVETSINELNNSLNVIETVKFVVSEEGIKAFLVKKILKVLNSRIAYYLKKLDANCLCKFNEYFEEQIIDEKSNEKSYFNFSGGERKRIDLSCLFAFADIRRLQGDVNFGTVFYDELFDSSLDDKGVQLTINILRERFQEYNESCYVITHRGDEVLAKSNHIIKVIKKNGISSIDV